MATTILLDDGFEIPAIGSLAEFRAWATSVDFPEFGRIDYVDGRIEVEMSPEDLYTHGKLKGAIYVQLFGLAEAADLGDVFVDRARLTCVDADVSAEPDVVFVSHEAIASGRVRLVPKASGERDRYVELEGAPDLVVEVISDHSAVKDTRRLFEAYWRAGIAEYWLADARGAGMWFQIYQTHRDGFQPAQIDENGFQHSAVFNASFRIVRSRHRTGRWTYQIDMKRDA